MTDWLKHFGWWVVYEYPDRLWAIGPYRDRSTALEYMREDALMLIERVQ